MQPKKNWFLRKKDGAEYGPVSINDLLRWSAQCRIVAGNAVSTDREEWIPVEEIPELEMHWMAHRADGKEYGPFALAAVQELFTHNVLPADAVLINRLTGENKPLSEVIELPDSVVVSPDETKKSSEIENDNEVNAVNQVTNQAEEHEAATEAADSEAAAEDALAEEVDAPESAQPVDLTDRDDLFDQDEPMGKTDAAGDAAAVDIAPLLAQIDILRQELLESRTEATESSENYLAKIALLEKKLQNAQVAARDAAARLATLETERQESKQQAGDDLAELRKQTAFMKKNIAALHTEIDEVRSQATLRARIILALGSLLTVIAALLIIRTAGGCRHREDVGTVMSQNGTETLATAGVDSQTAGRADTAATTEIWPALRIDGLRIDRKQDHLAIRFEDGAFASLTNLTASASVQLKALVDQCRPNLPIFRFVVEGHSDNTPVRATAAFADNAALAEARAETGAAILRREGAQAVAAINPGPPPYPNDTPENRRRNRTLLIKLYRR